MIGWRAVCIEDHLSALSKLRQPGSGSNEQLGSPDLLELLRKMEQMPRHELGIFQKATHNACAGRGPIAVSKLIQALVQVWNNSQS